MTFKIPSIAVSDGPKKTKSQKAKEMWRDPMYRQQTLGACDQRHFRQAEKRSVVAAMHPEAPKPSRRP